MPAHNLYDKDKTSITERIKAILLQIFDITKYNDNCEISKGDMRFQKLNILL